MRGRIARALDPTHGSDHRDTEDLTESFRITNPQIANQKLGALSLDTRFRFVYNARTRTIVQLSRVIAPTRNFSGLDKITVPPVREFENAYRSACHFAEQVRGT